MIESGELGEGFQMPSSRDLATSIGVNRSTVIRAYEELWAIWRVPPAHIPEEEKELSKEFLRLMKS